MSLRKILPMSNNTSKTIVFSVTIEAMREKFSYVKANGRATKTAKRHDCTVYDFRVRNNKVQFIQYADRVVYRARLQGKVYTFTADILNADEVRFAQKDMVA